MYKVYEPAPPPTPSDHDDSGSFPHSYPFYHQGVKPFKKSKLGRTGRCLPTYNNVPNSKTHTKEEGEESSLPVVGSMGQPPKVTPLRGAEMVQMEQDLPGEASSKSTPHHSSSVFKSVNSVHKSSLLVCNDSSFNNGGDSGIGESSIFANSKTEASSIDVEMACKRSLLFKCSEEKPTPSHDEHNHDNIQKNHLPFQLRSTFGKLNFKSAHSFNDKENFLQNLIEGHKLPKSDVKSVWVNNTKPIEIDGICNKSDEIDDKTLVSEIPKPDEVDQPTIRHNEGSNGKSPPSCEATVLQVSRFQQTKPADVIALPYFIKTDERSNKSSLPPETQTASRSLQTNHVNVINKPFEIPVLLPAKDVVQEAVCVKSAKIDGSKKQMTSSADPFKQPANVGPAKIISLEKNGHSRKTSSDDSGGCLKVARSQQQTPQATRKPDGSSQSSQFGSNTNIIYVNTKPYTCLSLLGQGGSSKVYLVHDKETSRLLAVKCVDLSGVEKVFANGYLNEVELLFKLQGCDSVIRMFNHEYVDDQKMLYVVMEKGDTDLSKLIHDISKTKKISMPMIIYYWTEMLNAVKEIHDRGIIHSDLKPANFLLVSGRLKLIDFGIASSLQGDMTSIMTEVATGTINYMSPEAIRNHSENGQGYKITYRSDVWSLGCILYNLVYGKTPFAHLTRYWMKLHAIADESHVIPFPEEVEGKGRIPPIIIHAMKQCLLYNPKERPTVAELLNYPYITSSPPSAQPMPHPPAVGVGEQQRPPGFTSKV